MIDVKPCQPQVAPALHLQMREAVFPSFFLVDGRGESGGARPILGYVSTAYVPAARVDKSGAMGGCLIYQMIGHN